MDIEEARKDVKIGRKGLLFNGDRRDCVYIIYNILIILIYFGE